MIDEQPQRTPRHGQPAPDVPGYEVGSRLGSGGTAEVWGARRLRDDARRALKVLPAGRAPDEAWLQGRLVDEHLVPVDAVVRLPDGRVALDLPWYDGGTLIDVVGACGHLAPGESVTALSPLGATLARLHARGVVHGDVSPGNVLFDRAGRPMLADLGASRVGWGDDAAEEATVGFVAPEVLAGHPPSPAADTYGLAALAWFALTGRMPPIGALRGDLAGELPPALAGHPIVSVVESGLAGDPAGRPTAGQWARALYDAAPALPLRVERAGTGDLGLLTRRLREVAVASAPEPPPASGRRPLGDRLRALLAAVRTAGGRRRRVPFSRRVGVALAGIGAVLALALAAVFGGVFSPEGARATGPAAAGPPSSSRPSSPASGSASKPATGPATGSAAAAATPSTALTPQGSPAGAASGVLLDREAPRRATAALVAALAEQRTLLFSRGGVAGLEGLDVPDSPAWRADAGQLQQMADLGQRLVGLTLTPGASTLASATTERAGVRTTLATSAHTVWQGGQERAVAATPGSPVLLDLRWTRAGWRVYDVRAAT